MYEFRVRKMLQTMSLQIIVGQKKKTTTVKWLVTIIENALNSNMWLCCERVERREKKNKFPKKVIKRNRDRKKTKCKRTTSKNELQQQIEVIVILNTFSMFFHFSPFRFTAYSLFFSAFVGPTQQSKYKNFPMLPTT